MALEFTLRHRAELFPQVPIVFLVLDPKDVDAAKLPDSVTGVAAHVDVARTLELAMRLQPGAREIVVVSGASDFDRNLLQQTVPVLEGLRPRISWRPLSGLPLRETVAAVAAVPKTDIVLILCMIRDGEGRPETLVDVARQLAAVSPAPVYGWAGTMIGTGVVGGATIDFYTEARQASKLALEVLQGRWVAYGSPEIATQSPIILDWRALQHWNLPVSRVPSGATVMFRSKTLWEEHRAVLLGILAVGLAQSGTILGLLVQRARRRRTENALLQSQSQINLAAQAANLGLWIRDLDNGEVWATEKCRSLFGFQRHESLTYDDLISRLHPADQERRRVSEQKALTEHKLYDTQYRVVLPDNSERWLVTTGKAQYDARGRATRMFGVCMDITERRRADQETRELRAELAHASRVTLLSQLASTLAHELSQPLGAILRNAEAAELFLQMPAPDLKEILLILSDIRKDDQRAGEVIDRMRAMLKREEPKLERLQVDALLGEVIALIREDALLRQIVIRTEVPHGLPPVQGDRIQFQQVLLNLIVNAMDALAEESTATRVVQVGARMSGAALVEVSVSDTGPGLPAGKVDKLFQPFFTTKPDGMGIGLVISRTIIESHGGRLWAENNPIRGATFRVTMPIAQ